MRLTICILGLAVVFAGVFPQVGAAGEAPVSLEHVYVTATRGPQEEARLPFRVQQIEEDDILLNRMPRTTPEALSGQPSVLLQKTAHGQGSPFLRGFTGYRNLMLIDGVRLNNSTFRDGPNQYWNTVDPYSLERIELVMGPGSVLYGSDAVGGTVQVFTKNAFDQSEPDQRAGGRSYLRYSTAEDSVTVRNEGFAVDSGGRLGLYGGLTWKGYGDLRTGDGRQPKTGYDEVDVDARADAWLLPEVQLTLAHQTVVQNDAWRTHKTIYGTSFHGTTLGNELKRSLDQERNLTYARVQGPLCLSVLDSFDVTLSHQRQWEEQERIRSDGRRDVQAVAVNTLGLTIQSGGALGGHDYIGGIEWYHDQVDSSGRAYAADGMLSRVEIQGPVADDAEYSTVAAYLQDVARLTDHADLLVGARYTFSRADADSFEDPLTGDVAHLSRDWDSMIGQVRLLVDPGGAGGLTLFSGVSQGFRAPNLSDLTRLDTARSDELETASPHLEPEYFVSTEVGLKAVFTKWSAELTAYHTDICDMIVRTPTGRVIDGSREVTKQNAGDGYVQGLEVSGSWDMSESWCVYGEVSWMEGEVDTYPTSDPSLVREPLSRLMPLTGNAGLRYAPCDRWWVDVVVQAAEKQDKLSTEDRADTQRIPPGGTPGYAVASLRGGYLLASHLRMSAGLENLADKNYRVHGSGINEPGRNMILAIEAAF